MEKLTLELSWDEFNSLRNFLMQQRIVPNPVTPSEKLFYQNGYVIDTLFLGNVLNKLQNIRMEHPCPWGKDYGERKGVPQFPCAHCSLSVIEGVK